MFICLFCFVFLNLSQSQHYTQLSTEHLFACLTFHHWRRENLNKYVLIVISLLWSHELDYTCHIIVTIGSNSTFFTWDFFVSQSVWKSRQRKNPQNGQNDWQKGLEGCRIMFQIQCRWKSYMHRNDKLRFCMRGGGHLYKRILLDPKTSKRKW